LSTVGPGLRCSRTLLLSLLPANMHSAVCQNAARSLAIFGRDPIKLGHALVRIALIDDSASSRAVWLSLLAFSGTHRHQVYAQAVQLKIAALEAMATVKSHEMKTREAIQHVAAGMLLCSLEVIHHGFLVL
jgi:hypothetical protein